MFNHVFVPYVVVASAVFGIVMLVLIFAVIRYRAGRPHEASQKSEHNRAEAIYGAALVVIAATLAVYVGTANASERAPLGRPTLHVTIVAFQWCWDFDYVHDGVKVRGDCSQRYPTLVVPTHEIIEFSLISRDVIHEWWLPEARWKEEAFPDHYNNFQLRFSITGRWQGRCDEFCGLYHDEMDFFVKAEPKRAFDTWLSSQRHKSGVSLASSP